MENIKTCILSLALIASLSYGMDQEIDMPAEEVLRSRLNSLTAHCAQKTGLLPKLAGQKKSPAAILLLVSEAMDDYADYIKNADDLPPSNKAAIRLLMGEPPCMLQAMMLKELLEDNPAAIQELQELGACKK